MRLLRGASGGSRGCGIAADCSSLKTFDESLITMTSGREHASPTGSILRGVLWSQVFFFPWLVLWALEDNSRNVASTPQPVRSAATKTPTTPPSRQPVVGRPRGIAQGANALASALMEAQTGVQLGVPGLAGDALAMAAPAATVAFQGLAPLPTQESPAFTRSDLLGGELTRDDLTKPAIHPLALAEQARAIRLGDPFLPLPRPLQQPMRQALQTLKPGHNLSAVKPARMVHVPSRRAQKTQQVPLVLQSDGSVDVLHQPEDPIAIEEIKGWSARQERPADGEMQPAVVVIQPAVQASSQPPLVHTNPASSHESGTPSPVSSAQIAPEAH
jgi:hypothetical protein